MSRIGKMPITVPAGVEVKIDGSAVTVKGPKGTLVRNVHPNISVKMEDSSIQISRPDDNKENRALHGLTRSLIANMVTGVSEGYKKELEINGVGFRAAKEGKDLVLNIGFSHQVIFTETEGITIEVPAPNKVTILGADKQKVGQFAADVRKARPPEPYKGKGIKYAEEVIRRKEGKAGKGGK
ncbi:MAG: 50S ribosomal protein L6 [Acutalibacteraceae bacterium]|jgi:large subunit ribosomal protein L6